MMEHEDEAIEAESDGFDNDSAYAGSSYEHALLRPGSGSCFLTRLADRAV